MNLHELGDLIQEEIQNTNDDIQLIIATRAGEALAIGTKINAALGALGNCPSSSDFEGWDSWWSTRNRLVTQRHHCDGILSVCLEVMGFDYRDVQNVIEQASKTY